jgi:hypothetical protein
MLSPSHARFKRKEDNLYSVGVAHPPALNRYRDFDKNAFNTHLKLVVTEKYVAKSLDQIQTRYSDQK